MPEMKLFSQQDPAWKNKTLGNDSSTTIGNFGCLLTDLAMVCTYYGFDVDPAVLNDRMKDRGGFQAAYVIPAVLPSTVPGMIYRNFIQCRTYPAPMAEVDASLALGKPVIVEVDYAPKAGLQNHWVVVYAKRGEDYLIRDPWPYPVETGEVTLKERYGFAGSAAQVIQAVVWLEGPAAPQPKPEPVVLDTGVRASFAVFAAAEGLALRSQPIVSEHTLIKRFALNTRLEVLVDDATAETRIGQVNQWLPVKDPEGEEGYTAGWFVSKSEQTEEPGQDVKPANPNTGLKGEKLVLKVTGDGLALRRKAEFVDSNIIKRLPLNSDVVAMETVAEVRKKLGKIYQWIRVRDVTGEEGLAAAWYLVEAPGQAALGVDLQKVEPPVFGVTMAPPEPLALRVAEDGLAFRRRPIITQKTLIRRLALNTELLVLEPEESAVAKLGQPGAWLLVKDVKGKQGYVAAWHVMPRPQALPVESRLEVDLPPQQPESEVGETSKEPVSFGLFDNPKKSVSEIGQALENFVKKVGDVLSEAVSDATTLEVSTFVTNDMSKIGVEKGKLTGNPQLRALTIIKLDGDTVLCVPQDEFGKVDVVLWNIHLDMVKQAQVNRSELIKAAVSAVTGLTKPGGG